MINLLKSRPYFRRLTFIIVSVLAGAALAGSLIIAGAHVRYGLMRAATISIEAPDQVRAGEICTIRIHATGLLIGAGVEISGDAIRHNQGIDPIKSGWNSYRVLAPAEPGFYTLKGRLYAVDSGNPSTCGNITPSRIKWMPPTKMCQPQHLDQARAEIEVVSVH
jgi:hypothetical protein